MNTQYAAQCPLVIAPYVDCVAMKLNRFFQLPLADQRGYNPSVEKYSHQL